ncbi:hypothetical protein Vc3S01_p40067 (plasmid) [Vibrio campbellii]|nr:hypothetical protein Vc3S01_p40067 [Vibrio campbellii]
MNNRTGKSMKVSEEQKLSLEAGEFIHTIANFIIDGNVFIDGMNVNADRANIIMEISQVLRFPFTTDDLAPLLTNEGFLISQHPRSSWIDLASRLLTASENQSISDIIKIVESQNYKA